MCMTITQQLYIHLVTPVILWETSINKPYFISWDTKTIKDPGLYTVTSHLNHQSLTSLHHTHLAEWVAVGNCI